MLALRIFSHNKRCGQVSIGKREMERITIVGRKGKFLAPSFLQSMEFLSTASE
jgi:hypothetical protein